MKRNININHSFAHLRNLPIEISFEQVQQWVEKAPPKPLIANGWLSYWLSKLNHWKSSKN